jgi:tetratricopeptide (TPR) repeat protein
MFDNEIMTQGQRLKKIRQLMLRATQTEIAQGVCTKNMISQVEMDKKKLSINLATKISENLNRIANKKGLNLPLITPDELMINNDKLANDIFKTQILNELKEIKVIDLFEKKLSEAEELIEKYNITDNKKIELYKFSADFYYYKRIYSKSERMCDIGLKISISSQNSFEEVNFYIYRSRNNIFTGNYVRALQQLDYAEKINNCIQNDELSILIFYNKALIYKRLGEYDTSLKYFKILKQFDINDYNMLLKVKMVYANCLMDYDISFDEAEKEYKEILSIAMKYDNKDFIALAYSNLSELYFNEKDYKLAGRYAKESLKYNLDNEYLNEILYFVAKMLQSSNEDVEMYLLQSLEICEKKDAENLGLIEKVIYELVLIYIKKEDKANLMLMANKAKEFNIDYSLIYLEIADYYRNKNNEEKSKYFNSKSKEKLKQTKKFSYNNN